MITHGKRAECIAVLLCCLVILLGGCATSKAKQEYYDSLSVDDPDLVSVKDDRYSGEHSLNPPFGILVAQRHVELWVVIADHSYKDIIVITESLKNNEYLAKMRKLILERQTLQIDALTGATSLTGKAYLKAIESALK
jgi:uncharacterized protein with FMN-binding domain